MLLLKRGATAQRLHERQQLLTAVRGFFATRGVLEVTTPSLSLYASADPNVPSIGLAGNDGFLRTSPESALKQLVAEGVGDVYEIGPAFRLAELGHLHQPEFTLLEWYRQGFDHHRLMDELQALLEVVGGPDSIQRLSYSDLFERVCGIAMNTASDADLVRLIDSDTVDEADSDDNALLHQLIYMQRLEPTLAAAGAVFLYDYPRALRCYARIDPDSGLAQRFELIVNGIEVANGYHEIIDEQEQRQCFERENGYRRRRGLLPVAMDEAWLAALRRGLPPCAGVAVGMERLQLVLGRHQCIDEVVSFAFQRGG